ncbi:unnamed protein product, partial [Mesorhabditis spiculigera]
MCETTAFVQIMENILASAKKPNPRDFFVNLANSIYSPERSSIPQPSVDPREEWAARLVDASENDDIEMVIGVIVRYSFRDIHNLLSLEPCLSDLTGRGTKLQKMAQHCLLSYSAYDPLDAAESLLRLFFKPEEAARLRIDPTAAELPSAQLSCLPFVEGKACPVTSEQLPPREAVDLNHLSGYLSEDASTSIYGDTSLPTVKAAVDLTANTLIFAQSTVLSKKFNAHKVDWIHEIARGTDLVFGREGMKLLKISRPGERDELRICAIQKGRRAIFSSKIWKGEEKPAKPDVVIEFGKENMDITTRSDAADEPTLILGIDMFVPTEKGAVVSVEIGPRVGTLSGYLSEDASTSIYGDTSLPTVKAAVDLTANTLIFAQSTVLSKKFNAHKVDWIHEIARGTDLVFGREGMKLLKISRPGERDELRICAIQKGRRAIFSSKIWKGEEKPSKPDVVIEFGKENMDITTRSDAADEPTLILGIDMFVPTEKGAVVSVEIGPRVGTVSERRLCHLDFDAGRLTTYSSQRLDESTETLAACTKGCGNCLLIADQGHRFCVTELPTKIPEVAEPVDEPM